MSEHVLSHSAEMLESVFTSADSHHSLEALLMLIRSRPPPWLKTQCTQYLSQILLRANGVQTIFECLLPPNSALGTLDTAQLQHVAQIIGSVPKQSISVEEYFENICPQLLRLMKTSPRASMLFRASTHVIGHVINRRPGIGKKHLLNKLMFPLLQFYETIAPIPTDSPTQLDLNGNCILVDERTLSEAIDNLRHLLVGNDSSPALIDALASVVPPLYYIQDFATQTASSIKQPALDILLVFFRIAQSADAGTALWRTILELPLQETAILARGPEGGVLLTEGHGKRLDVDLDRFIDFLDAIKNDDLVGSFFLRLLEHHGKDHHEGADEAVEKLRTIQLILSIMGRYGEHILKKPAQIVTFSKSMLLSEDEEAVSLGMALLTAILSNDETVIETEINTTLEDILIILQALSAHEKDEISFLARELRVLIVTRNSSLEADDDSENQAKRTSLETLQEAMKELADDLLPVRAHGMHLLRHLVLAKDPVLKERIYETNAIFLDQIKDDDSFIYLNAIKGLASLTDVYPGATLTSIAERYAQDAFNLDYRLRIGEALLQTMQRCGDVFAKYALKILPPIFQVLHSDVPELRSSALSLLACVAETAPLSLLPFIHQLMDYVRNLLLLANTNPEPRRAAAVLLLSLVRALRSGPLFAAIDRTVVRDIATRLDILKDTDTDELTRIHARTALADLDDIVAEHLGM
ncbi:hypothetical protein DFJ77DRAFT_360466 [Powellomyces hirtus]|nr:hypothetical protein DFJ77DRAFT_360466 [Powellomyces hirtus]